MSLSVSGLGARYGRLEVCRNIEMCVGDGEFLVVLGANGAGKSSLLGSLAGVVAGSGRIALDGRVWTVRVRVDASGWASASSPKAAAICSDHSPSTTISLSPCVFCLQANATG